MSVIRFLMNIQISFGPLTSLTERHKVPFTEWLAAGSSVLVLVSEIQFEYSLPSPWASSHRGNRCFLVAAVRLNYFSKASSGRLVSLRVPVYLLIRRPSLG
jgi:hypothetical protein